MELVQTKQKPSGFLTNYVQIMILNTDKTCRTNYYIRISLKLRQNNDFH